MEENTIKDKILTCRDCGRKFTFTVGEQKFFGQKGWRDPFRCRVCSRQKKILKLRDKVKVEEAVRFSEICDKCGRQFYTEFKRKQGEKVYCFDCWKLIKG